MKKQAVCRYNYAVTNNLPQTAKPVHDIDNASYGFFRAGTEPRHKSNCQNSVERNSGYFL